MDLIWTIQALQYKWTSKNTKEFLFSLVCLSWHVQYLQSNSDSESELLECRNLHISEAFQVQIEVQQRLHEQMEVQYLFKIHVESKWMDHYPTRSRTTQLRRCAYEYVGKKHSNDAKEGTLVCLSVEVRPIYTLIRNIRKSTKPWHTTIP